MPSLWVRGISSFAEGGEVSSYNVYATHDKYLTTSSVSQLPGKLHQEFQVLCGHNSREGVFVTTSVCSSENLSENAFAVPALLIFSNY